MRNAPQQARRQADRKQADRKRPAAAAGFTLLELLVVLVILGLLASVTAPAVARYLSGAKIDAAKLQIQNLSTTLDMYRLDTGSYPSPQDGLRALVQRPAAAQRWNGPYLRKPDMIKDPWGREYLTAPPANMPRSRCSRLVPTTSLAAPAKIRTWVAGNG